MYGLISNGMRKIRTEMLQKSMFKKMQDSNIAINKYNYNHRLRYIEIEVTFNGHIPAMVPISISTW